MLLTFTKMQGAGNDFVVINETSQRLPLTAAHYRYLADRHFGVGADQILSVRPAPSPEVDFEYAIHNADGGEVEQCGNGARCFARYVVDRGLTTQRTLRVLTPAGVITPVVQEDGRVSVDMGAPIFALPQVPFDASGLTPVAEGAWQLWSLDMLQRSRPLRVAILSMGNPHAVQRVRNVDAIPLNDEGAFLERHPRFAQRVNAGFMQVLDHSHIRLRVFERGVGETLACGTGACAAVVAGIRCGLLDARVDVSTSGGILTVDWAGNAENHYAAHVYLTGPAETVFEGQIELPQDPEHLPRK
jgi:diaminopimelate epimerase